MKSLYWLIGLIFSLHLSVAAQAAFETGLFSADGAPIYGSFVLATPLNSLSGGAPEFELRELSAEEAQHEIDALQPKTVIEEPQAEPSPKPTDRFPVLFPRGSVQLTRPEIASASVGIVYGTYQQLQGGFIGTWIAQGPFLEATAGLGGGRLSAGYTQFVGFNIFWVIPIPLASWDVKATVLKPWSDKYSWGSSVGNTYGGIEGDISVDYFKVTAGVFRRLRGDRSGKTLLTLGAGFGI